MAGAAAKKRTAALHPFRRQAVALHVQLRVHGAPGRLRRKTGREAVPHFDRFDVPLQSAALQGGAESGAGRATAANGRAAQG